MTIARGAAIGSLIAAVVAVGVLMFGGGGGHNYVLRFQNAGQLVNGNQVQVAGKTIGKIKDIELTDDNQARIKINIQDKFAPLHEGTLATIRYVSLPSIANRNISLTLGPNSAPKIPDGGLIDTDRTTTPVDLDQIFDTLDPKTRKSLQNTLYGFANWYSGRGKALGQSFKYLGPTLSATSRFMRELLADQKTFTNLILDGSRVVTALAERSNDVAGFVTNTSTAFKAIGDENVALGQTLQFLPGTLRRANTTFVELRGALNELDRLTNATKPLTPKLAPFFRRLNRLVRTSTPTFHYFANLISQSGSNNDLTDLLRKLPALSRVAHRSSVNGVQALKKSQPVIEFIRPYAPDFNAWIEKFAHATGYYDANGHYARVLSIFNAFKFVDNGGNGQLVPLTPAERQAIITDRHNERRCPGGATQPAPDGSNPYTDNGRLTINDCNPAERPPGP